MDSVQGTRALPRVGFPIRKSPDQRLFSVSPGLIAAVHVLHRLLMPRHPPCALIHLIRIKNTINHYAVIKERAATPQGRVRPAKGRKRTRRAYGTSVPESRAVDNRSTNRGMRSCRP